MCKYNVCLFSCWRKEIGNEHVILMAQQAVEKVLKAALFAEIGTAEKHHNLNYFAQRAANKWVVMRWARARKSLARIGSAREPDSSLILICMRAEPAFCKTSQTSFKLKRLPKKLPIFFKNCYIFALIL